MMETETKAEELISKGKYLSAAKLLDTLLLTQKNNDNIWYLRGVASLRRKNYEYAHECFERASIIRKKPEYFRAMGMTHLEIFELEDAIEDFEHALSLSAKDVLSHFFLSLCYLFMDSPKGDHHMKAAYSLDKKRTKQLLSNFYHIYFRNDPRIHSNLKSGLEKRIKKLNAI